MVKLGSERLIRMVVVTIVVFTIILFVIWKRKKARSSIPLEEETRLFACQRPKIISTSWFAQGGLEDSLRNFQLPAIQANVTPLKLTFETDFEITKGGIVSLYDAIYMAGPNPMFIPALTLGDATSISQSFKTYAIQEYFPFFLNTNPEPTCSIGYSHQSFAVATWRSARNVLVTPFPSQSMVGSISLTWDEIVGAEEYAVEVGIRGFLNRIGDGTPQETVIYYGGLTRTNAIEVQVAGTSFWNTGSLEVLVKVRGYQLCAKSEIIPSCIARTF